MLLRSGDKVYCDYTMKLRRVRASSKETPRPGLGPPTWARLPSNDRRWGDRRKMGACIYAHCIVSHLVASVKAGLAPVRQGGRAAAQSHGGRVPMDMRRLMLVIHQLLIVIRGVIDLIGHWRS